MLTALVLIAAVMLFAAVLAWLVLQLDGPQQQTGQGQQTSRKPMPTHHRQEHREQDAA
jgi:hypothetical protein